MVIKCTKVLLICLTFSLVFCFLGGCEKAPLSQKSTEKLYENCVNILTDEQLWQDNYVISLHETAMICKDGEISFQKSETEPEQDLLPEQKFLEYYSLCQRWLQQGLSALEKGNVSLTGFKAYGVGKICFVSVIDQWKMDETDSPITYFSVCLNTRWNYVDVHVTFSENAALDEPKCVIYFMKECSDWDDVLWKISRKSGRSN